MNRAIYPFILLAVIYAVTPAWAAGSGETAWRHLQEQWAIDNYQLNGKAQKAAFAELVSQAEQYTRDYPDNAAVWVWSGIVKSTYAGVKGGLGALKYAKASRADLEKALALEPQVLNGSAYTSLGTLYFRVPGWPLGFGNDDKAEELLKQALAVNPQGIDPNYFYGEYLRGEKRYQQAREHLQRALQAAPRPGRELADQGRRAEIRSALAEVEKHL